MATPLEAGQSRTVTINAQPKWNDTGIQLAPGRYRFEARGTWTDWFVRCGPEGHHSLLLLLFEQHRRVPRASWCALCGSVGHDEAKAFVIGKAAEIAVETAGELSCFANDAEAMYWNNQGAVALTVTCLSLKGAEPKPELAAKPAPAVARKPPQPKPTAAPEPTAPKKKAPARKAPAKKPEAEKKAAPAKTAGTAAPKPKKTPAKKMEPTGSAAARGKAKAAPRAKPGKPPAP